MSSRWLTLDRLIALVILIIALAYINASFNIRMLPFELRQPFKPNTYPLAIGTLTAIIAFFVTIMPPAAPQPDDDSKKSGDAEGWRDFDWLRFGIFFVLMTIYATFLRPAGFIPSTVIFLFLGSLLLGEKRIWISLPIITAMTAALWYLVTQVLSIFMPAWPSPGFLGSAPEQAAALTQLLHPVILGAQPCSKV